MTFGSARQKMFFFRVLANKMRAAAIQANGGPTPLGGISCRDAFLKDKVTEAKALVDKGMGLKYSGLLLSLKLLSHVGQAAADFAAAPADAPVFFPLAILLGEPSKSLISLFTFKLGTSIHSYVKSSALYGQYQQALQECLVLLTHQAGVG
jgi:hypothetical protein